MKDITDDEFDAVVKSGKVLVDFYSTWCQPCKALAPLLEALEGETPSITFVKMNIDDQPVQPSRQHVNAAPTMILFEGGHETKRYVGMMSLANLRTWLGV